MLPNRVRSLASFESVLVVLSQRYGLARILASTCVWRHRALCTKCQRPSPRKNMGKHSKKCTFQHKWLQKYSWVKQVMHDPRKAQCTACMKTIDLSVMGESALTSHAGGTKHIKNLDIKSSLSKCGLAFVRQEYSNCFEILVIWTLNWNTNVLLTCFIPSIWL